MTGYRHSNIVLLYSLVLIIGYTIAEDGTTQSDDKRNVATLARNGELPFRQEWKKFVHPLTWQTNDENQETEKRFLHPVATSWQDNSILQALEKRFSHPLAWQIQSKRFSHPVAYPWQERNPQDEIEKRFSHPVASAWQKSLQDAWEKRFTHPISRFNSEKRFVGALARSGNLGPKRSGSGDDDLTTEEIADALLAELVAEFLQRQEEEEEAENDLEEENSLDKRFVASIARTGALPSGKRNIAAMARDGYIVQHRPQQEGEENATDDTEDVDALLDEVSKRHLGALAKSFNMPAGLTSGGKRNVGVLARSGLLPRLTSRDEDTRIRDSFTDPSGKRNIQALLKQWRPVEEQHGQQMDGQKRHLGSLLSTTSSSKSRALQKKSVDSTSSTTRTKRQAPIGSYLGVGSMEYPVPVMQGSDFYDYEEDVPMQFEEKRFLGRIPHMGRGTGRDRNNGAAGGGSRRRPRGGGSYSLRPLLNPTL